MDDDAHAPPGGDGDAALDIELSLASTPHDLDAIRTLFLEYQDDIGIDLCFQGFAEELATLPGAYAPPLGALVLARVGGEPAGCCALRPLFESDHGNACEMKRLFVRRAFRGFGLGRQLAEHVIMLAQQGGYDRMLLDTLHEMEAARALYHELGFEEIPPYYHNPLPGAHYLKLEL
ncbi:MAG: GNAT family N-acetyltransferase [Tepidimonas ignava]|jgi:GNAT superfamily N-acetyltransferase|uniref:Acetyltransferase (GNAT) family protein n=1 Tax=Tepidimonas ignava TaxID=114249 RepID=A0A4R3L7U7_9BURK|nr:GNAT family N-acetyltransferase [Tepidimonas ignava]TCS93576.1 acetyltransferase (GNAT) family protein [Tepidimonas ignava]TSE18246.1 putative N-acetyltransferase YsnE [Tepidimonas ignava]